MGGWGELPRTSEEEALLLAICLWDWFYEIKYVVAPLPTAFSLSSMVAEFSSACFFFIQQRKKMFIEPQNSSSQHLFTLIEWLSMCEKKMAETKRISKEWPRS